MKAITTVASIAIAAAVLLAAASPALAHEDDGQDDAPSANGPHPAIVVQRLHAAAGYDYASKFYPHPARFELLRQSPHGDAEVALTPAPEAGPAPVRRAGPARLRTRVGREESFGVYSTAR